MAYYGKVLDHRHGNNDYIYTDVDFWNDNTFLEAATVAFLSAGVNSIDALQTAAVAAINDYATNAGYTPVTIVQAFSTPATVLAQILAGSPSSYQTIVSQSGTAAPAVAGGFTSVSTYSGAPTFTWARTSAGVYTLTASSAIFNTSGKTGVFVAPLTNLNGSIKAVVTSSTIITVTTAVQSLAILGLLGFTATPTDALLDKTMIYIQTYA